MREGESEGASERLSECSVRFCHAAALRYLMPRCGGMLLVVVCYSVLPCMV